MPLSGGTFTSDVSISDPTYGTPIAGGPFQNSIKTKQNRINFSKALSNEGQNGGGETNSNDPGYIIHETSNAVGDENEGVIHLCPTDDNSGNDYVAIHGTNDPTTGKFYTSGSIVTPGSVTAAGLISTGTIKADGGNVDLDDHDLLNVHGLQFKDWDDNSGGSNDSVRILRRDGCVQVHNGGLRIGPLGNNDTFATGQSQLGVYGNVYSHQLYYAASSSPVGYTVAAGREGNSRTIALSNGSA